MWAIVTVRALVKDLYQVFGDLTLWCWDNDPPFGWFGDRFLDVYLALTDLHYALYELALWFEDLEERVAAVITESTIFQLLQKWLNYAEDAWSWVLNSVQYIGSVVNDWWLSIIPTVQGWIAIAVEGFDNLKVAWDSFWAVTWPEWTSNISELRSLWDNFWTDNFPTLLTFDWLGIWWDSRLQEIDTLIGNTIKDWLPFYDDLVELWDGIVEFFVDPWAWLYDRLEDFMDRYW